MTKFVGITGTVVTRNVLWSTALFWGTVIGVGDHFFAERQLFRIVGCVCYCMPLRVLLYGIAAVIVRR